MEYMFNKWIKINRMQNLFVTKQLCRGLNSSEKVSIIMCLCSAYIIHIINSIIVSFVTIYNKCLLSKNTEEKDLTFLKNKISNNTASNHNCKVYKRLSEFNNCCPCLNCIYLVKYNCVF